MRFRAWLFAVVPALSWGCTEPCQNTGDCERGSYCELGQCKTDCVSNLDCGPATNGKAMVCTEVGRCATPIDEPVMFDDTDGAQDPVGSGDVYIVSRLAISGPGEGFDLDNVCGAEGCADNKLSILGDLLNSQIRQNVLGGGNLLLIEIAGLDGQSTSVSQDVTLKFYGAGDADEPYFPADNFKIPPGYDTCCEFVVLRPWLTSDNQARVQIPARIENGTLVTQAPFRFDVPLYMPVTPEDMLYEDELSLPLEAGQAEIVLNRGGQISGRLGGAAPINRLAGVSYSYCATVSPRCPIALPNSSLLTVTAVFVSPIPDIDLDGDGLECTVDSDDNRQIDVCCDGAGFGNSSCTFPPGSCVNGATQVRSTDPADPEACTRDQKLADGYSIAFDFDAVSATIVGVR